MRINHWCEIGVHLGAKYALFADFDEQGNYLRQVNFEYRGRPYTVDVYGYLDGARVSLSKSILYGDGNRYVALEDKPKTEIKNEPDSRYDLKYEFKYENGKLVEMQLLDNRGEKYIRHVYKYQGNQKETAAYLDDGELNSKYLYTLDDKGNEIERLDYNVRQTKPSISGKFRYKYETYDKEGNWTKRTFFQIEVENGKEVSKPLAIEYRIITYYESK